MDAPFSSARRVRRKTTPKATPPTPSQTRVVPDADPRMILQVWESADGLRRCIVEDQPAGQVQHRKWRCLRIARPDTVVLWDAPAQVVGSTVHWLRADLQKRIRTWLVYRR